VLGGVVEPLDGDHHVDDRLRGEPGDGGRAVVLDREREVAQRRLDPLALAHEGVRPARVVLDDDDRLNHARRSP
jgi:hypothetical protein